MSIKLYFVPAKIHSYAVAQNFGLGRTIERLEKLFYAEAPWVEIFWQLVDRIVQWVDLAESVFYIGRTKQFRKGFAFAVIIKKLTAIKP